MIIGMLFGTIAGTIGLFLGSSVLLALAIYAGVGNVAVVLVETFYYIWSSPSRPQRLNSISDAQPSQVRSQATA
jgi:hypothetical protein